MNINSIINEWTYRLPKGYPDSEQDYEVLRDVLIELTELSRSDINTIVNKSKGLKEQDDSEDIPGDFISVMENVLTQAKFDRNILDQIINTYNTLSPAEQSNFQKNFRKHSIESYVAGGYQPFIKFNNIVPIGKAAGGMGRGEVPIILGVADTETGGTGRHDIVMTKTNKEWEVKELTKAVSFDPAKYGAVTRFPLTYEMQEFYKTIVEPFKEIGDPVQSLKDLVNPESIEDLKKLIMIIETRFAKDEYINKVAGFREISYTIWQDWYTGFQELNNIFYRTNLDTNVKDTRLTVNTGGSQKSYWISDEDVEEIELSSGEDTAADVYVGDEVDNINSNVVIWFKRVERSKFIKNPNIMVDHLQDIKNGFFEKIEGLIFYFVGETKPNIGTASMFATTNATKSIYRFRYKERVANLDKYSFIANQS